MLSNLARRTKHARGHGRLAQKFTDTESNDEYTEQVRALKLRKLQLEVQYLELTNAKLQKELFGTEPLLIQYNEDLL